MLGQNEGMNEAHLRICASPEWAAFVESELLPWVLAEADLGDEVLEVGPGPGLTTDVLRRQVPRLTAVEIDERLARSLAGRLAGTNVTVLHADATALPFEAGPVLRGHPVHDAAPRAVRRPSRTRCWPSCAGCCAPGGVLAGTDGVETPARRELHVDDDYLPIDPATMADRLAAAGFTRVTVEVEEDRFRFAATAPGAGG